MATYDVMAVKGKALEVTPELDETLPAALVTALSKLEIETGEQWLVLGVQKRPEPVDKSLHPLLRLLRWL